MVRFYEFSDVDLDEDLSTALDIKKKALDVQSKTIANRKTALANRKAKQANRDTIAKMATNHLQSK